MFSLALTTGAHRDIGWHISLLSVCGGEELAAAITSGQSAATCAPVHQGHLHSLSGQVRADSVIIGMYSAIPSV